MTACIAEWPASSPTLGKLFDAHAKALGQLKNAPRQSKSHYGRYADLATVLDTIRPVLAAHGLSVMQCIVPYDEGLDVLVTTMGHASGEWLRSYTRFKSSLAPQQYAASVTYLKRCALTAIVGVAADDEDDGQTAQAANEAADAGRVELAMIAKIRSAKTRDHIAEVLDLAKEQALPDRAMERLRNAANERVNALRKPEPVAS